MGVDKLLDLLGVDILSAPDDHIFEPPCDPVVALRCPAGQISGVEPAVRVNGRGCRLGHFVISLHDIIAARDKLADHFIRAVLSGLRIHDLAFHLGEGTAHRSDTDLERIRRAAHCAARGSLGLAVDNDDLRHVHFFDHIPHDRDGAGASRHDPGAHKAEICLLKIRMLEHGDEHGGDPVESRHMFVVDAGQRGFGRKIGDGQNGPAVGHGGRHCQHHTEAVEHRHLDHEPVRRGQIHAVPDTLAVVDNIVMREHHALGKSGRAGRILHVGDIVDIHRRRHAPHFLDGCAGRVLEGFLPGDGTGHPKAHRDHIAKERQAPRVQSLAGLLFGQFRTQLLHDLLIIGIPVAVDHHQCMGVGLPQQIFRLMDLVGGIHRHQHRADLGRRPEGQKPLGHIGRPDRHLGACTDAERNQDSREFVHIIPKLRIGAGVIERRVFDRDLVGELLHHGVEHLGEGLVDQRPLLPDVFSRVAVVPIEMLFIQPRVLKPSHHIDEMGEDDLHIRDLGHPVRIPFKRNKPVIVDGAQRVHELLQGKKSVPDELRHRRAVFLCEIMNVYMPHIGTEVGDGPLRILSRGHKGGIHVPERGETVVGKTVQKIPETLRVRVEAGCLHKDDDRSGPDHLEDTLDRVRAGIGV